MVSPDTGCAFKVKTLNEGLVRMRSCDLGKSSCPAGGQYRGGYSAIELDCDDRSQGQGIAAELLDILKVLETTKPIRPFGC